MLSLLYLYMNSLPIFKISYSLLFQFRIYIWWEKSPKQIEHICRFCTSSSSFSPLFSFNNGCRKSNLTYIWYSIEQQTLCTRNLLFRNFQSLHLLIIGIPFFQYTMPYIFTFSKLFRKWSCVFCFGQRTVVNRILYDVFFLSFWWTFDTHTHTL